MTEEAITLSPEMENEEVLTKVEETVAEAEATKTKDEDVEVLADSL
jgi:hypothetical protein